MAGKAAERLNHFEEENELFERSLGLTDPQPLVKVEADRWLNLPEETLLKLSPGERQAGNFVLERYAFFLQRATNREAARVRWAEENLRRFLARETPRQRANSYEERRTLAIANSVDGQALDAVRVKAQLRLDQLNFLAVRVTAMAKSLHDPTSQNKTRY